MTDQLGGLEVWLEVTAIQPTQLAVAIRQRGGPTFTMAAAHARKLAVALTQAGAFQNDAGHLAEISVALDLSPQINTGHPAPIPLEDVDVDELVRRLNLCASIAEQSEHPQ